MKIRLVYRNYKPLHEAYASLAAHPPQGVTYIVPAAKPELARLHKVYRKIRFAGAAKPLIRLAERILFTKKNASDDADLYQYLNIVAKTPPPKPYIVDTEHAAGLISFTPDAKRQRQARDFLKADGCRAVTCWSEAAARTLHQLMGEDYGIIESKVHVVYPTIEEVGNLKPDFEFIDPESPGLKVLMVGNQVYLKGTEELLTAVARLNQKYGAERLQLHIVSKDAGELVSRYNLENVKLYPPKYDKKAILQKFFMPADIFAMPTKQETFGMALLDALACGTPVITTNQFACREIVDDGRDGWLLGIDYPVMDSFFVPGKAAMDSVTRPNLDEHLADQIYLRLCRILDGKIDLEKMARNGQRKFKKGQKFAFDTRNLKLKKIYQAAVGRQA